MSLDLWLLCVWSPPSYHTHTYGWWSTARSRQWAESAGWLWATKWQKNCHSGKACVHTHTQTVWSGSHAYFTENSTPMGIYALSCPKVCIRVGTCVYSKSLTRLRARAHNRLCTSGGKYSSVIIQELQDLVHEIVLQCGPRINLHIGSGKYLGLIWYKHSKV